jgi:hypothetical protein
VSCVVTINTDIPKSRLFRFENYWVDMPGFSYCIANSRKKPSSKSHSSAVIADKLKCLRYELKK